MKQHIKKLSILFLLATLLASCDAEEMYLKEKNSNNGEPVIKTLSYKEAGETFNRLKNELKIEKHLKIPETSNLQARTIKDTLGFLIETDLIKQVTLGEYKSYTMKLVKEIEGNIFFNLTIEDKNGESSMFMTCYIPSSYWVNNKDEAFQGVIVSRRMNTLTQYQEPEILFDDIINSHFNHDLGVGPGGGGTHQYNQNYPYNCNGIVIVSVQQVAYQCGCGHWPDQICGGCPQADPYYPGYNQVPFYYCQEDPFYSGSNPDNPTNPSTGGPTSPNPDDTSITAMIKPEECKERIVGDLNRDCQLSPYETCLLGGNSQEVCDCVAAGGKLADCLEEADCNTSKEDLKLVFPNTPDSILEEIATHINDYGKDFGINTKEKLQHFLAQAGHESTSLSGTEFGTFTENLNYRVNKLGTEDYWERYFNPIETPTLNPEKANPNDYISSTNNLFVNKEMFANYVYNDANRSAKGKLGNVNPGDGYKFIGRGIIQLTGRSNYTEFNSFYQEKYDSTIDLIENPQLAASDMKIAVISALWFFKNKVLDNLNPPLNNSTTCKKVSYLVNGGTKGLKHRNSLFENAKNHINCL